MPRIYITEPNHFYTYELPTAPGAEVLIGTAPHCQLALPGVGGLGDVHACISCQPQGYVIADLGSPTGTFANGVPIRSEFLMPGVEYRLGAAVITLAVEGMPPQQPPMGMPMQPPVGMPPQQPPVAQAAAQQQAQPAAKKKASPLKTGGAAAGGATKIKAAGKAGKAGKSDLASMAAKFDRSRGKGASRATFLYVVVLLVIAFYAGIALHHWERTGNCLPGLVPDEQEAPVQPAPAPAVASEPSAPETPAQPEAADTPPAPEGDTQADDTPAADDTPVADDEPSPEVEEPTSEEPAPEEDDSPEQDDEPAASED